MSDLALILAVAVVTFASRVVFLASPRTEPGGRVGRFLEVFPVALFIALATIGLAAPDGQPEVTVSMAAAAGGIVGGAVFRRSLWGVIAVGAVSFYAVRLFV
ncbi:MAG: AzlD domain-containing protein [Acidimicrobiia bacterium]|nr:AzlD domain-containing protein [Acidimicrobiia bacterium]